MAPKVIGFATVVALISGAVYAAAPSYFPLTTGATWVRRGGDGAQITADVTGTRVVGGAGCTIVETVSVRSGQKRVTRSCYRVTAGAVLLVETEAGGRTTILDPPRPVLLLSPAPGKTWVWTPKNPQNPPGESESNEWTGEETVRVAAGTFKAWQLQTTTKRGILTFTLDTWYAPGVGIVKIQREISGQGRQAEGSSELISYRIP